MTKKSIKKWLIGISTALLMAAAVKTARHFTRVGIKAATSKTENVSTLIQDLNEKDIETRVKAACLLALRGAEASEATPALIKALDDQNEDVRRFAAIALGMIDPEVPEAVPALMKTFLDKDRKVRESAAIALGKFGPKASASVPTLMKSLNDEDQGIRQAVARALAKIGADAVPALIQRINDQSESIQSFRAVNILAEIGDKAKPAIPALQQLLKNKDTQLKKAAMRAIAMINKSQSQ
jgi:HEAT repeat protein